MPEHRARARGGGGGLADAPLAEAMRLTRQRNRGGDAKETEGARVVSLVCVWPKAPGAPAAPVPVAEEEAGEGEGNGVGGGEDDE